MNTAPRLQPLAGLRVLDFTTLLPGPLAGLILAEAGAEVIKIERPGTGEDMRHYSPRWGGEAVFFAMLNRGKKSLALDLKSGDDMARLEPLLRSADVLIEQFRPGVMERLGLGYEAVSAINPRIVYCSVTGYGQTGPKAPEAGHDINYIGATGLLSLSPGAPTVPPVLIADLAGGTYPAVVNVLLALMARHRTGRGSHVDIAMTDHLFMLMSWAMGQGLAAGAWPKPGGELLTGGSARYRLYPASDGRLVALGALEQRFWDVFCDTVGLPAQLREDARDPVATIDAVAAIIASRSSEEWRPVFLKADCCCSIVQSLEEALRDPHFAARGLFDHKLANEAGETLPATPVCVVPQFRDDPAVPKGAPALGAHHDELLG